VGSGGVDGVTEARYVAEALVSGGGGNGLGWHVGDATVLAVMPEAIRSGGGGRGGCVSVNGADPGSGVRGGGRPAHTELTRPSHATAEPE